MGSGWRMDIKSTESCFRRIAPCFLYGSVFLFLRPSVVVLGVQLYPFSAERRVRLEVRWVDWNWVNVAAMYGIAAMAFNIGCILRKRGQHGPQYNIL